MVRYYPLQKRGSIRRHCNVFEPKKHCGTTTFSCNFDGGNMIPCQTPKSALRALHFQLFCRFYLTNEHHGAMIIPIFSREE